MKRAERSNKPGINKAAQAGGKNSQNILDAGVLVIQRSSEEVTGRNTQEWMHDNLCPTAPRRGIVQ